MNPDTRSRPGQRMTRKSFLHHRPWPSRTAAFGALLAVAVLAALAAGLIGGGSDLAHRRFGGSVQTTGLAAAVGAWAEPLIEQVTVPQVPADAETAQSISTF